MKRVRKEVIQSKVMHYVKIRKEKAKREGVKLLIDDILNELGGYCDIGLEAATSIYYNRVAPSLTVSLKLSEYFNVTVNDLYQIKNDSK